MHEEAPTPAPTTPAPAPSAPLLPLAPPAPLRIPPPSYVAAHSTTTIERGSFCLARCTCGWSGPARRSRDRARTDAEEHLSTP
ncbi:MULTISPECIES: hypothetical protein [unclassified Streptomyces]|uniref:hypothetical protein n=1 Tax=unclassified Streptomyces TaxID=2593676 RepID=UPI0009402579|nr:hypothetical protein [Streptomyces sp. TSRI0281]